MLDTIRCDSVQVDERSESPEDNMRNMEKNCNQIFMKGPELTKNFWEKMQTDVVPSRTYLFGYEMRTRRCLLLTGLTSLLSLSLTGVFILWFTNAYIHSIYSLLVVSNTSQYYNLWVKPTPKPLLKFYVFNYTNVDKYEAQDEDKLHVEEIGPYVYEETFERYNVHFNDDDTVSYQIRRKYRFVPELSKGRQNDRAIVPNIPLLAGAALMKPMNFIARMSYSAVLNGLDGNVFINMPVHKFITGYSDDLYELSKSVMKLKNQKTFDKFGLLAWNTDVEPDVLTMNTGASDITKLCRIEKVNGNDQLNIWSTDECNSFKASEGQVYPPPLVKQKKNLELYLPQACRTFPLVYSGESTVLGGKIPAYRYKFPENLFDHPDRNLQNQCFCNLESGNCPPQGLFNATPCAFGAPLFISFPHMFKADPAVRDAIEGLKEEPPFEAYESYLDLHPEFGFVMNGRSRLQINVQIHKAFGINQLRRYEDGAMLPMAWVEAYLMDENLTDDIISLIYQTTYTVKGLEMGLKYGCLLTFIVTVVSLVLIFRRRWQSRSRTSSSSTSPLARTQVSIEE